MEGAASSQLVRMPGSGANAREEPFSGQQGASGAPAAQEKTEVAKRKRDKPKKNARSPSPMERVARALPTPETSGEATDILRESVDSPPTPQAAVQDVVADIVPAETTRDAIQASDLALASAELSSTEFIVGGQAAGLASAARARDVARAADPRSQVVQWPWMTRFELPTQPQLLLEDVPVVSLLDVEVANYVEDQKIRWQACERGLNCPRDPAYSQVNRERMTEWVTATVRLNHFLRQSVELSPEASWLAALRVRHVCLPVPSDLRAFSVPLGALSAPEVIAVLQTALEEAGYEFLNLAPEWFSHGETRDVPVDTVRLIAQDVLAAMKPMMEIWRWVAEGASCTMPVHKQPFVHVEDFQDVDMLEVDEEGDVLMIEGVKEFLTTDLILRVRTVSERHTSSVSTDSGIVIPRKRHQRMAFVPGSDVSLPPAGFDSSASSESRFHSPTSWDQDMSDGTDTSGVVPVGATLGPAVMMAQAVTPSVVQQYVPGMLALTGKHWDATVEPATLPALPTTPPRAVTPPQGADQQSVAPVMDTILSEQAQQIRALQRQIGEMQLRNQSDREKYRLEAERENQRLAREQRALQEEVVRLQQASARDHRTWEETVRQHQTQLQQQAQQAEQQREAEKVRMWEEFRREASAEYREFNERAEERRKADLLAAEQTRAEQERLFRSQMNQRELQFQQQQDEMRLQHERERRQRQVEQQQRDAHAKRMEEELDKLRLQHATAQLARATASPFTTPPPVSTATTVIPASRATSVHSHTSIAAGTTIPTPVVSSTGPSMSGSSFTQVYASRPFVSASSARPVAPAQPHQSSNVPFGYRGSTSPWQPPTSGGPVYGGGPTNGAGGRNGGSAGGNAPGLPGEGNQSSFPSQVNNARNSTPAPAAGFRMTIPFNSIAYFKGTETLEERKKWWNQFAYSADVCMWEPEEKCKYLPMWLEGSAKAWYRQLDLTTRQTWKVLSKKFQEQFCTASDSVMERYLEMVPRRNEKPLHFLWRLNAAAARAQIDTTTAKTRQKHIKRFLQKLTDKTLKYNLAARTFFSMQEFEETLKMYHEVTGSEDEHEVDALYRNEVPRAVQFKKVDPTAGRFRPKESNPGRAYWAEESQDNYRDYDSSLEEEESEEQAYAAQVTSQGPRNSFNQPQRFNSQSGNYPRSQLPPGAHSPSRTTCAKCKRLGHSAENCWNDLLCETCGERGHLTERCFRKPLPCPVCANSHSGSCPVMKDFFKWIREARAAVTPTSTTSSVNPSQAPPTTPPSVNSSPLN